MANKLEIEPPVSIGQRIAGAEKRGEHKTSMLQDLEAGRPMELDFAMPLRHRLYSCTNLLDVIVRGGKT